MASFKEGDVVTLKSGSPDLTVGKIWTGGDGVTKAEVFWFVGHELKTSHIPVDGLKQ
jgi:uncharacterized protein YodC (DUF2158 family)